MHDDRVPLTCAPDDTALTDKFPGGVAPRATLVARGMSHSTISARCRPGQPWQRPIPGVIVLNNGPLTRHQLARSALVHAGRGAMLTGITAARLHGVEALPEDRQVHVLIPHRRGVGSWGFAVVERTIHAPEPTEIDGLPVVPLSRALFDAARRMDQLAEVRAMIADAVSRGLCTTQEIRREVKRGSTIGSALVRRVLRELRQSLIGTMAKWAKQALRLGKFPEPEWRHHVRDARGITLQAYWTAHRVAWHIDTCELGPAQPVPEPRTGTDELIVRTRLSDLRANPQEALKALQYAFGRVRTRPPPAATPVGAGVNASARPQCRSAGRASYGRRDCGQLRE